MSPRVVSPMNAPCPEKKSEHLENQNLSPSFGVFDTLFLRRS